MLLACGGGGDSNSAPQSQAPTPVPEQIPQPQPNPVPAPSPSPQETAAKIQVIDGYIANASVCADRNNSQTCEQDEYLDGLTDDKALSPFPQQTSSTR